MSGQTPQIPASLQAAMAEWSERAERVRAIDSQLEQLDVRIGEYTKALADLRSSHRSLGIERGEVEGQVAFARGMVEHGCQALGIEMPGEPLTPAPAAPAAPPELPAGVVPVAPDEATANGAHPLGQPQVFAKGGAVMPEPVDAAAVLGAVAGQHPAGTTLVDGDAADEGRFRAEPGPAEPQSEPQSGNGRRGKGGRRG